MPAMLTGDATAKMETRPQRSVVDVITRHRHQAITSSWRHRGNWRSQSWRYGSVGQHDRYSTGVSCWVVINRTVQPVRVSHCCCCCFRCQGWLTGGSRYAVHKRTHSWTQSRWTVKLLGRQK